MNGKNAEENKWKKKTKKSWKDEINSDMASHAFDGSQRERNNTPMAIGAGKKRVRERTNNRTEVERWIRPMAENGEDEK